MSEEEHFSSEADMVEEERPSIDYFDTEALLETDMIEGRMHERIAIWQRKPESDEWELAEQVPASVMELTADGALRESEALEVEVSHIARVPDSVEFADVGNRIIRRDGSAYIIRAVRNRPLHKVLVLGKA